MRICRIFVDGSKLLYIVAETLQQYDSTYTPLTFCLVAMTPLRDVFMVAHFCCSRIVHGYCFANACKRFGLVRKSAVYNFKSNKYLNNSIKKCWSSSVETQIQSVSTLTWVKVKGITVIRVLKELHYFWGVCKRSEGDKSFANCTLALLCADCCCCCFGMFVFCLATRSPKFYIIPSTLKFCSPFGGLNTGDV